MFQQVAQRTEVLRILKVKEVITNCDTSDKAGAMRGAELPQWVWRMEDRINFFRMGWE